MRIGFSGSGGTGKTTVAKVLAEGLGLPLISEGVREYVAERGITNLRGMTAEETFDMQRHLLQVKKDQELRQDAWVSDRTTADNIAYCLRWCGREDGLQEAVRDYVREAMEHLQEAYDLIFFFPHGKFDLTGDGVRSAKPMYQLEIEYLLRGILAECAYKVHVLEKVAVADRLAEIRRVLKELLDYGD